MSFRPAIRWLIAAAAAAAVFMTCSCGSTRHLRTVPAAGRNAGRLTTSRAQASCHSAGRRRPSWIVSAPEIRALAAADSGAVAYAISAARLYVPRASGGYLRRSHPVAYFTSYRAFARAISGSTIAAGVRWVMYDNERWAQTPVAEQDHPLRYERLFADLAHRHGYLVILAPAQDLVASGRAGRAGGPAWRRYLARGFAAASARVADIYEIQAQADEAAAYRRSGTYLRFVRAAAAQARAARPGIVIFAGLSTQRVTSAAQLLADFLATHALVAGYWLNIPHDRQAGPLAMATRFLRRIPARLVACGG